MKSSIHKKAILLTSTINVNTTNLKVINNNDRLYQYINAIKFYINHIDFFDYLIVCDNSNFNYCNIEELNHLKDIFEDKIEFLHFESESTFLEKGKGYGEGQTIKYAFNNSQLIKKSDTLIKITGRIIVKNIKQILSNRYRNDCILCIPYSYKHLFLKFTNLGFDTRIISFPTKIYNQFLLNIHKDVDDNFKNYLEIVIMKSIKSNDIRWAYFDYYPNFTGISGSTGNTYEESNLKMKIKNIILHLLNIF